MMSSYEENAAQGRRLLGNNFDQIVLDDVATWDKFSQDYFWAYAYERFEAVMVRQMERDIRLLLDELDEPHEEPSFLPFRDAEESISAHGWFGNGPRIR